MRMRVGHRVMALFVVLMMCLSARADQSFHVKRRPSVMRTEHQVAKKTSAAKGNSKNITVASDSTHESDNVSRSIDDALKANRSVPWSIVVGLTLLTLLPALLLSFTPLVRLLVVFHFLRQALGTQTAPSNQVLMGLGLMMTWFLMQPVLVEVEQKAVTPYRAGTIS